MRKRGKIIWIVIIIGILIIIGLVIFQLAKDREEYEFYYVAHDGNSIIKYSCDKKTKDIYINNNATFAYIYDIFDEENIIINGNFEDNSMNSNLEISKEKITNLDELFNVEDIFFTEIRYLKSNQDIACTKNNQILVYHKDTKEVEKVFEIEEDPDYYIKNFDFSYDGNTLYYVYNGTLFIYDINEKTSNSILNNVSYFDVSTDESKIVYFNIVDKTLYLMNVNTGEVVKVDKETWRREVYPPIFNEEGTAILYAKYAIEPTYVWYYIYNIDSQKSEKVLKVTQGFPAYGWY